MKARAARGAAFAGLALASLHAAACGHCIEDRIAAVYDHQAIGAATARGHAVAFLSIEGDAAGQGPSRAALARAITSMRSVDAVSLRVSADAAAIALSYDPRRISSAQLVAALNAKLATSGLAVSALKVLQR